MNKKSMIWYIAIIMALALIGLTIIIYTLPKLEVLDDTVIRVIDGDTFELATNDKVRLICVDTPELGDVGSYEAKDFLEFLILNKEVRLEKDISETDKYGRLLRYVYVNESSGEIFVNKEIVKECYGEVFRYGEDVARCDEIEDNK